MSTASYAGDGIRMSATFTPTGGQPNSQSYVWDVTAGIPRLLMDSSNAYIYGPSGTPIEQVDLATGTISYLAADSLGSVRGVVASDGSLTASTAYDAWGNPETNGGLSAYTPFGYAGGYTDPTWPVYLINRYYDPATGQFLSVDPLVRETGQDEKAPTCGSARSSTTFSSTGTPRGAVRLTRFPTAHGQRERQRNRLSNRAGREVIGRDNRFPRARKLHKRLHTHRTFRLEQVVLNGKPP